MVKTNEEIIAALMASRTNAEAAKTLHVSETWLYKRMADQDFKQLYKHTQTQLLQRAADQMTCRVSEAVTCIAEIMNDTENAPSVRLQAATAILKHVENVRAAAYTAEDKETERIDSFLEW